MLIQHKVNGGLAEVEDALGKELVAGGTWQHAKRVPAPKKGAAKAAVVDPHEGSVEVPEG
jgi:hypothetical protein